MTSKFIIHGGKPLFGTIKVQTSKNATLPILAARLMANGQVEINDLKELKVDIVQTDKTLKLNAANADNSQMDFALMKTMRSSIFLLGSMLARFKMATITQPGGCKIGARPIDIHLTSLKKMGVKIVELGDAIFFTPTMHIMQKLNLKFLVLGQLKT